MALGKMQNSKLLIGALAALALVACTRPDGEKTKVTFTLPTANIGSAKLMSSVSAQSSDDHWGQQDPSSVSDIGCWGVFVGGPNQLDKKCLIGAGSSFRTIQFGQPVGLFASGSQITIDVDPGDRHFYLLGMRKGSLPCEKIDFSSNADINSTNYSQPLLLGEATQNISGASASVTINAALNLASLDAQRVGSCSFMPGKDVGGLRIAGPASGSGTSYQTALKSGVCGKYKLELTQASGNGGIMNDKTRSFVYSRPALTGAWNSTDPLEIYTDAACTTKVSTANPLTIFPGEDEADFYVKGSIVSSDLTSPLTVSDMSGVLPNLTLNARVASSVTGTIQLGFFDQRASVPAGTCQDIEYYVTTSYGGTSFYNSMGPYVFLKTLDKATSISVPTGEGLKLTCATTSGANNLSLSPNSFGTFSFQNGLAWNIKDVVITDNNNDLYVNVQKRADLISVKPSSAPAASYFASDCISADVTAMSLNSSLVPLNADLTGYDDSGTSTAKRVIASIFGQGLVSGDGVQLYDSATCVNTLSNFKISMTSGMNPKVVSFRPSLADEAIRIQAWGWPFVNSSDDSSAATNVMTINSKWDPSLLSSDLKAWLRPLTGTGTTDPGFAPDGSSNLYAWNSVNYPSGLMNFTGVVGTSTSTAISINPTGVSTSPDIPSLKLGASSVSNVHLSGTNLGNFSISMLVRRSTITYGSARDLLTIGTGGTRFMRLKDYDNSGTGKFELETGNISGTCSSPTILNSHVLTPFASGAQATLDNKWVVVTLTRAISGTGQAKFGIRVMSANGTEQSAVDSAVESDATVDALTDYIFLGSGAGTIGLNCSDSPFEGDIGEVVIRSFTGTSVTDDDSNHQKVMQYFKSRYPGIFASVTVAP